jgi:hypothetical protein
MCHACNVLLESWHWKYWDLAAQSVKKYLKFQRQCYCKLAFKTII